VRLEAEDNLRLGPEAEHAKEPGLRADFWMTKNIHQQSV
jgi:hypothetical protein